MEALPAGPGGKIPTAAPGFGPGEAALLTPKQHSGDLLSH
jgi:hypothetical protein